MMRSALGALAAVTALTLTACGSDDDPGSSGKKADPTSESSSESSLGSPSSESGDLSAEELQAKVVTGEPPKDLAWVVPTAPSEWRELDAETGTRQWQVGESRCVVTLNQPAGVGTSDSPTSEEVANDYATSGVSSAGGTADLEPATERLFPNHVNADAVEVQSQFAGVHFTGTPGDIEGQAYGYRAGDFALRALALCGNGEYADHGPALEGFLETLAAQTTY